MFSICILLSVFQKNPGCSSVACWLFSRFIYIQDCGWHQSCCLTLTHGVDVLQSWILWTVSPTSSQRWSLMDRALILYFRLWTTSRVLQEHLRLWKRECGINTEAWWWGYSGNTWDVLSVSVHTLGRKPKSLDPSVASWWERKKTKQNHFSRHFIMVRVAVDLETRS